MSQSRSPSRREELLQAGIAEFARHPYPEARTDRITAERGISKGLLFHYFGSKREFYLACLTRAMDRLTNPPADPAGRDDPLEFLMAGARRRVQQAIEWPTETALANRAAREASAEVLTDVRSLLARYQLERAADSHRLLAAWAAALPLRPGVTGALVVDAVQLQVTAVLNRRLVEHLEHPERFLAEAEVILGDLRAHLDLILHGALAEGRA